MKKLLLFTLLCCYCITTYCQKTDTCCNDLKTLYVKSEAECNLQNALTYCLSYTCCNPSDYYALYDVARYYALSHKADSAFTYLLKATQLDNDSALFHMKNGVFVDLVDRPEWNKLADNMLQRYEKTHGKIPKREVTLMLFNCWIKDQSHYEEMRYYPSEVEALWTTKNQLDLENLSVLQNYVKDNGWPKYSEVGKDFSSAAFLIVQHQNPDSTRLMKRYLKLIKKAVKEGEWDADCYALLYDRIQVYHGKKQLYGTQGITDKNGKVSIEPIKRAWGVDKRRKKMGLKPLSEYLKALQEQEDWLNGKKTDQ